MPDVPVAAPAAAAPAVSAPVSTPVSTPASTPTATPEATPVSSPVASTSPETTPATTAATPAADATKPGAPKREDYPQTGEGIQKFLEDTYKFEEENPDGTQLVTGDEITVETPPPAEKSAEELAAEEAAKSDEQKVDDPAKPAEVEAPTPEGLAKLMEATPALKELLEANPEAKGALFAMARQNAKAAPILEVFPNVESAKFASENANEFVGLKTAFTLSDTPEKMKDAAGMFLEQFQVVDDKGAPVLDAKGQPTYGDDLPLFVSEIKNRDNAVRIADLQSRIDANQYATPEGKQKDDDLLSAYLFIQSAEAAGPDALDVPDTSQMTPEGKAYFEREQKKLQEEKERLGIKSKEFTQKQMVETREKFNGQYREKFGGSAGLFMATYLQQKEKDGVAIPRYMLEMKDPKSGVSAFALNAFARLNAKLESQPNLKAHSATLQMNAINDQGLAARVKWGQERIDEFLPGIIDDMLTEAGISMKADAEKKIADRNKRQTDARVEPAAGGPVIPKGHTPEQLYAKAKENVLAQAKGAYIAPEEIIRKTLIERDRLEAQR